MFARADTTDFGYKMGKKKRGAEEAAPNLRMLSPEQIDGSVAKLASLMESFTSASRSSSKFSPSDG
mgnify:CR=1 FL=1